LRIAVALQVAAVCVSGGAALAAEGGGITAPRSPELTDITCVNRCAGLRDAAPGARVRLSGRNLDYVEEVRFNEEGGGRVGSEAQEVTATSVEAIVPDLAETGKPQVVDSMGATADSPVELKIVREAAIESPSGAGVADVSAAPDKGFFMGKDQATASFIAQGNSPVDVRVDVVSKGGGGVVRSLVEKGVEPGKPTKVRWNGKTDNGKVAPNGSYEFQVKPLAGGNGDSAGFEQYDHMFPLKAKHVYGDGLGAGRGHQGQDLMAKCGKRIVAARGGKVQHKAYHSAAGNYVVIDGKDTNVDYVYMHLRQPSKLHEGEKVKTGGLVGIVGDTGDATACHLHFEMWDGDWYGGGKLMDPTPPLKRWDDWS
jgi:murein DD-endopeptidase MepM/ murein hydrolase activator NlpD